MKLLKKNLLCTLLFMVIVGSLQQLIPPIFPKLQPLSCIVIDATYGGIASNITTKLFQNISPNNSVENFVLIATRVTDAAGKILEFLPGVDYVFGLYRMLFKIGDYYQYKHGISSFFPDVQITFENKDGIKADVIPVVINPYGFNTYRGSSGVTNATATTTTPTAAMTTAATTTTPTPGLLGGLLSGILRLLG